MQEKVGGIKREVIVTVSLALIVGLTSLYEGLVMVRHPQPISSANLGGLLILFSIVLMASILIYTTQVKTIGKLTEALIIGQSTREDMGQAIKRLREKR